MGVAIMGVAHGLGDKENKTTIVDKSFLPFFTCWINVRMSSVGFVEQDFSIPAWAICRTPSNWVNCLVGKFPVSLSA